MLTLLRKLLLWAGVATIGRAEYLYCFVRRADASAGVYFLLGAVLLGFSLWRKSSASYYPQDEPIEGAAVNRRQCWLGWITLALGLAAFGFGFYRLSKDWFKFFGPGFAAMGIGIPLLARGSDLIQGFGFPGWHGWRRERPRLARWEWGALLLMAGLALFLRVHRIGEFPPPNGVWGVEEPQGIENSKLLSELKPKNWEWTPEDLILASGMWVGGVNLPAARTASAICGALAMIPLYLLLRTLAGPAGALFGTALGTTCFQGLVFDRYCHNAVNLLVYLVFCLLVRSYRSARLSRFLWAGTWMGFLLYAYVGYRLVVALAAAAFLWQMAEALGRFGWQRIRGHRTAGFGPVWRRALLGPLLAGCFTVLMFLPVVLTNPTLFIRKYQEPFVRNMDVQHANPLLRLPLLPSHMRMALDMLLGRMSTTNDQPRETRAVSRYWSPFMAAAVLLGVAAALPLFWRRRQWVFLIHIAVSLTVITTLNFTTDCRKFIYVLPPALALAGMGYGRLWARLSSGCGRWLRWPLLAVGIATVAASGWWDIHRYFWQYLPRPDVRAQFKAVDSVANYYWGHIPHPEQYYLLFLSPTEYGRNEAQVNVFSWMGPGPTGKAESTGDIKELLDKARQPHAGRTTRVILQYRTSFPDTLRFLQWYWPELHFEKVPDPDDAKFDMMVADVPAGIVPATAPAMLPGLTAKYWAKSSANQDLLLSERFEPWVDFTSVTANLNKLDLKRLEPLHDYRVELAGQIRLATDGDYGFQWEIKKTTPELRIDGRLVSNSTKPVSVRLSAGDHTVQILVPYPYRYMECGAVLSWRPPGRKDPEIMPFYRLMD